MEGGTGPVGGGTTMTAGVVSHVGTVGRSEGLQMGKSTVSNAQPKQNNGGQEPVMIDDYRKSKQNTNASETRYRTEPGETEQNKQETNKKLEDHKPEIRENSLSISENHNYADELFETAKKEGSDAAFEKLAQQPLKVDDKELEESDLIEQGDHKENAKLGDKDSPEKAKSTELELRDKAEERGELTLSPIEQRVVDLEQKINQMVEESSDLRKRAQAAEKMARDGITTALELAKILKQLLEEEEEEKKKKNEGLLAILAKLIASMLIMITVSDDQQKEALEGMDDKAA